jgi:hypothetical protein
MITIADLNNMGFSIPENNIESQNQATTLIAMAEDFIETYTGLNFSLEEFDEYYDANYNDRLVLTHKPVSEVTSIIVNEESPLYRVDLKTGIVKLTEEGINFDKEVHIIYTAGYEEAPEIIKYAACELVQFFRKRLVNELVGETSKSFEGGNTSLEKHIPANILFILNRFRNSHGVV